MNVVHSLFISLSNYLSDQIVWAQHYRCATIMLHNLHCEDLRGISDNTNASQRQRALLGSQN